MTRWCGSWCLNISVSFSAFSFLSTPCQITFHTSHCLSDIDEKGMNRMPICCITHCHKFHTCNYIWQRFLGMCYSCSLFWKEKNLLSFLCLQHWWQHDVLMTRNLLRPFFSNEISSRFMCRNLYHISLLGWQNQLQLNFFLWIGQSTWVVIWSSQNLASLMMLKCLYPQLGVEADITYHSCTWHSYTNPGLPVLFICMTSKLIST